MKELHRRVLKATPTTISRIRGGFDKRGRCTAKFEIYPAMRLSRPVEDVGIMTGRPEKMRNHRSVDHALTVATRELAGIKAKLLAMYKAKRKAQS